MLQLGFIGPQSIVSGDQIGRGHDHIHIVIFPCPAQHRLFLCILENQRLAANALGGKGKRRIGGIAACNAVQHIAARQHGAAVEINAHIGVDTRIHAGGTPLCNHGAAIDDQPAVGVDAVPFTCAAINQNGQTAAVDSGYGNTVLIGIDAVIAADDVHIAAVQSQMHFAVQTFIFSPNVQAARIVVTAVHVQGHFGIECTVILVKFLAVDDLGTVLGKYNGLVNTCHIGAADMVIGIVGNDHLCPRLGGIHILGGIVGIAALIDIIENHCGSYGTGDIRTAENQRDYRIGILLRIVTQIHSHLTAAELARQQIVTGLGDGDHQMLGSLLGGMGIVFVALTVSKVLAFLVVHNVVRQGDTRRSLRHIIGQLNMHRIPVTLGNGNGFLRHLLVFIGIGIRSAAGRKAHEHHSRHQNRKHSFHWSNLLDFILA